VKFLSVFTPDPKVANAPPNPEQMAEMGKLIEESMKAGTLLSTGGLLPISRGGARVRCSEGKITVVDGPYTEAKEVVAGFAILQANSRDEAIEMVKGFHKVGGDGESDLHQIMDSADGCPQAR
jgi:hypothetical protein